MPMSVPVTSWLGGRARPASRFCRRNGVSLLLASPPATVSPRPAGGFPLGCTASSPLLQLAGCRSLTRCSLSPAPPEPAPRPGVSLCQAAGGAAFPGAVTCDKTPAAAGDGRVAGCVRGTIRAGGVGSRTRVCQMLGLGDQAGVQAGWAAGGGGWLSTVVQDPPGRFKHW